MKALAIAFGLWMAALQGSRSANEQNGDSIRLQLPPAIYATPGIEANVYFDNIVLTHAPNNYVFDVACAKGRHDAKRWRFVPATEDAGDIPWSVRVLDSDNRVVAVGKTRIIVVNRNAGEGGTISVLLVGDSLTDFGVYPRRINDLFKQPGNPSVRFVGSHSGSGASITNDGVCFEGYGGWSWMTFCSMWTDKTDYRARSKFMAMKDGHPVLDFTAYCRQYNRGTHPDFITIMLGINDVFEADDDNIGATIKTTFTYMDMLLSEFSRSAPKTKIGVVLPAPPAHSQDAFGANYGCGQTRWQYKRNQHALVQAMIRKFDVYPNKNVSLIPAYVNLDCENGYPIANESITYGSAHRMDRQRNGVHPDETGYHQIADTLYCWLKYQLSQ